MSGLFRAARFCASIAILVMITALFASAPAHSKNRSGAPMPNKPEPGPLGERFNANTIAIASGNVNATYLPRPPIAISFSESSSSGIAAANAAE